tara:strand:+ start:555 stop:1259 length:705 start_codon:yes stop_codon:yes gene_type:complete
MANGTSANLKLTVQATGENSGTWGQITNTNLLVLEQAIGGYDAVALNATTGATLAFSGGALSNGKNQVLRLTGTITTNVNVVIPDSIEKTYLVENATSGAFTVTFKTTSGTGATWSTTDKGYKIVYSDGTNIVDITADLGDITAGAVTSGGITATGNIVPGANDTYDLGASGNVWRNLYTGDLHLSNQAKNQGNIVDGTKGNWTLQEGKDDIFIINNISGDKFKINLSKIEGDL